MADHFMECWAWARCALFMHVVKFERKKPPFVFHCKCVCAIIIDSINHYYKCLSICIPCWSRPTTQTIASGIRMHTICLIKCILFHIYLCRLYVIIRRHGVETPSTLLALCEGNHLWPMDSPRNRPLWRYFGGLSWTNFWKQNSPVVGDLRVMIWRHWKLLSNLYFKDVNWNITQCTYGIDRDRCLKLVARWIRYSCVYFYLWPFRFVAVSVCGRSGLWPFRIVDFPVCGRSGLWPFRSVAVPVCGRFGLWPFRFWPFRLVAVMTRIRIDDTPQVGIWWVTKIKMSLVPFTDVSVIRDGMEVAITIILTIIITKTVPICTKKMASDRGS